MVLLTLRDVDSFDLFWNKVTTSAESLEVEEPQLPRRRKLPRRYDEGTSESEFHTDSKAFYRQHYYETIDLIVNCIQARFEQLGYAVYRDLEQLLVKASLGEDISSELQEVCSFYKDDFQKELLQAQLETFSTCTKSLLVVTLSRHLRYLISKTTSLPLVQPSNLCCLKYVLHLNHLGDASN
jgi:hypothetical protein